MAPEADTRRRKKNAKRGHAATPPLAGDVKLRSESGFIPGVPSFQDGGPIITGDIGTAIQGPSWAPAYAEYAQAAGQPGVEFLTALSGWPRQDIIGLVDAVGGRAAFDFLTQGLAGGAGASAGPQWRPGERELQQAQLELDRAIRTGTLDEQIAARKALDNARLRQDMIQLRGQNIDVRGQDIQAGLEGARLLQAEADSLRRDAIARNDAALAGRAQELQGIGLILEQQIAQGEQALTQRGQDITAQNNMNRLLMETWQTVNEVALATGNLQLLQESEQRLRAEMQQQVALDQHEQARRAAATGIEAQRGAATQGTQLAQALGNVEARRGEYLAGLAANPRDYMQMQFALGGGQNILNQLRQGKPFVGQSVANVGQTPMLGAGYQQLVDAVTQRRDLPYFEEARGYIRDLAGMAGRVPQAPSLAMLQQLGRLPALAPAPTMAPAPEFAPLNLPGVAPIPGIEGLLEGLGPLPQLPAPVESPNLDFQLPPQFQFRKGGQLVTDEPIVGIGQVSGLPRFTVGEPTGGYPLGKPELLEGIPGGMKVTPMQEGGSVLAPFPEGTPAYEAVKQAIDRGELPAIRGGTTLPPKPPQGAPRPPGWAPEAPITLPPVVAPPVAPPFGPRIALPMPSVPGATLPPGAQLPMINPLPPRTGELGEFIITGDGSAFINNPGHAERALAQAEAMGGHGPQFDWLKNLVDVQQQTREQVTPTWLRNVGTQMQRRNAAPTPAGQTEGEVLREFMKGMTPDRYYSLLPSQREWLDSIISALGMDPDNFWGSLFNIFPTGSDPSQVAVGTNF